MQAGLNPTSEAGGAPRVPAVQGWSGPAELDCLVAKGELAAHIGVHPSRVSQYISEGKLTPPALVEPGKRSGKIHLGLALRQLEGALHIGQSLLNGRANLSAPVPAAPADAPATQMPTAPTRGLPDPAQRDELEEARIAAAKATAENKQLETEERRRKLAADVGRYLLAGDVKAAHRRLATQLIDAVELAMKDMATQLALRLGVDEREALSTLRQVWREVREREAQQARDGVEALEALIADPDLAEDAERGSVSAGEEVSHAA
ncbi:hypothetical protein [Adonisia turfae]